MNFMRNIIPLLERNQLAISVLLSTGKFSNVLENVKSFDEYETLEGLYVNMNIQERTLQNTTIN